MKTKVTFKGLSEGRIIYRHIQIKHNFSIIPETEFLGYKLPAQSVESQVIDYLDSIDKSDIMLKYNFDVIIDYWVPKKKKKQMRFEFEMKQLQQTHELEMLKLRVGWLGKIFGCS